MRQLIKVIHMSNSSAKEKNEQCHPWQSDAAAVLSIYYYHIYLLLSEMKAETRRGENHS